MNRRIDFEQEFDETDLELTYLCTNYFAYPKKRLLKLMFVLNGITDKSCFNDGLLDREVNFDVFLHNRA